VMPFWIKLSENTQDNLFNLRTNLRYGCWILRRYLDIEREQHGEYYSLILFATLGMMFLGAGYDLIALYIALELMALTFYVLVAFTTALGDADVNRFAHPTTTITVFDVQTMSARMSASMARQRFSTLMLGSFALFALILAVVGVYGVMSHLVAQGAHDIGVRMALGAERSRILRMVMRQGLELTVAGSVLGLIGAAALTRVMASLLFGVSTTDAVTFAAVPLVLIATAMLASYVPARRATRVDPVVALRDE